MDKYFCLKKKKKKKKAAAPHQIFKAKVSCATLLSKCRLCELQFYLFLIISVDIIRHVLQELDHNNSLIYCLPTINCCFIALIFNIIPLFKFYKYSVSHKSCEIIRWDAKRNNKKKDMYELKRIWCFFSFVFSHWQSSYVFQFSFMFGFALSKFTHADSQLIIISMFVDSRISTYAK